MVRIIVSVLIAIGILIGGFFIFRSFSKPPEEVKKERKVAAKGVFVEEANNKTIPIEITSSGQLEAFRRVTLTAEVTGVLRSAKFKEGVTYKKGQTIFVIDDAETDANLASQRSNFYAQLLNIMPDLKLDYPEAWHTWDNYLNQIDIKNNLPSLPDFESDRSRNFITASGLITTYNTVKNLEIRSSKYNLTAPFNGVITEANVQEGSLVSTNQPLGEISSLGDYELELPVNISFLDYLKVGRKIDLQVVENNKQYKGVIERINPSVDVNAQSITAYIRVKNNELREGMYLQATVDAGSIENAIEINRKLLGTNNSIFIMKSDSTLGITKVEPIHFKDETVIVQGLEDGTIYLEKALPGAYEGMKVKVLEDKQDQAAL